MTSCQTGLEVIAELAGIVRKIAKVPQHVSINAESRLVEDLGIDSLDLVGVILQIQDEFDIVIDEDAVPNLCRVADLAEYLVERRGNSGSLVRAARP
jgi:acyl carrier protein